MPSRPRKAEVVVSDPEPDVEPHLIGTTEDLEPPAEPVSLYDGGRVRLKLTPHVGENWTIRE